MGMDKFGVAEDVLHQELRDQEANLMQQMQRLLTHPEKTASDRNSIERQLQQIRAKLTELDLKKGSSSG